MESSMDIERLMDEIIREDKKEKDKNADIIRKNADTILQYDSGNIRAMIYKAKYYSCGKKDGPLFPIALEEVMAGYVILADAVEKAGNHLDSYAQEIADTLEMYTNRLISTAAVTFTTRITLESISNVEQTISAGLLPLKYIATGEPEELLKGDTETSRALKILHDAHVPFDFEKAKDKGADGMMISLDVGLSLKNAMSALQHTQANQIEMLTAATNAIVAYKLILHSYACEEKTILKCLDKCNEAYRKVTNPDLRSAVKSIKDTFDEEVEEKLRPIREKKEQERKKKTEEYWQAHPEEKQEIESQIQALDEQIKDLENQKELLAEKRNKLEIIQQINGLNRQISAMQAEKKAMGLFRFKEKKAADEKIETLRQQMREKEQERSRQEKEINREIQMITDQIKGKTESQKRLRIKLDSPEI